MEKILWVNGDGSDQGVSIASYILSGYDLSSLSCQESTSSPNTGRDFTGISFEWNCEVSPADYWIKEFVCEPHS
jgi:hypothetical protein